MPMSVSMEHSILFLSNDFYIVSNQEPTNDLQLAIQRYSKYISSLTGISIKNDQNPSHSTNTLIIDCPSIDSKRKYYPRFREDESYILNITKSGLYLYALSFAGISRGLSTFVQLIERDTSSEKNYIPFVHIIDQPRFSWRGLLLDVSRHWMPVPVIERTLNAMEISKLNVLHLHLSDDHGFRVESIEHKLLHDKKDFFTQEDIKYIVEYARQRCIRIVPEFDIPGHTTSWFIGYPELATKSRPYQIETQWGVMKPTMDPTKENTYTFLDTFFKEITTLFPDPYFHIGGDEVEGSEWTESPSIQKFIDEHKLINNNGLHAYFNKRIQKMLKKYGKIMIGWEEVLDQYQENLSLDKDAVVQSWKSRASLGSTIKKGYRALLSHGYYLDHLRPSIFHYNIVPILPDGSNVPIEKQLKHILGGEACMWSEYVSQYTVDSRIWPRILTVAERLWSSSPINNKNILYERLFRMNHLLDKIQTGVTHLSQYKLKLENLIIDPNKKKDLLHPLVILADACEPRGLGERAQTGGYSSNVPLTTFADALQSESELIWKLESLAINDQKLRHIFLTWSLNHVRLLKLFDGVEIAESAILWRQNIKQLSENLGRIGRIGLRVFDYDTTKILHQDKNNTMNSWTLSHWITHHNELLDQLEISVMEIRLAAVQPVRRLLRSIQSNV